MKSNLRTLLIIGIVLICAAGTFLEAQFKLLQRGYDNFVLDNRDHYLPCDDLPTETEVQSILEQHQDIVQEIEQVAPGSVGVEVDTSTCDGKADLLIWYGTHQQRLAVEEIIDDETFFGVPYRLQNR